MNLKRFWHKTPTWAPADGAGSVGAGDPPADPAPVDPPVDQIDPPADPVDSPAAPDWSFLPEDVRGEEGLNADKFREHYETLAAEHAQFLEARAGVPEDGKYEFAVPDDLDFGELELPEGFTVALKADDEAYAPLFEELQGVMHKHGMPSAAAGEMMGLLAKMEATRTSAFYRQAKADFEKLGPNDSARNARMATVQRALEAKLPTEQAKALMSAAKSYDGVRALETLFRPRGPGPVNPQKTAVDLEKLPPRERLKAINQMQEGR